MKDLKTIIGANAESTKETRVQNCINSICGESKMAIMSLKREFRAFIAERESMLDLGITNTTDVASYVKDINAQELIQNLNKNLDGLVICYRKLSVRIAQHNLLFPEDKEGLAKEEESFMKSLIGESLCGTRQRTDS